MPNDETKTPPPYGSYGIFKSVIEQLATATVPSGPLDRRVLHGVSGSDYNALIPGMRFLGLVDKDRKPTETLRELVKDWQNQDVFKAQMLALLGDKYAPIIGNINLGSGTITELEKAFKDSGVSAGQMLGKTIRFFTKAMSDYGYVLSPYIQNAKPRAAGSAAKKNGEKERVARTPRKTTPVQSNEERQIPTGFQRMPIPGVEDGYIQYPTRLSVTDCDMFEAAVTMLRVYANKMTAGKEKKT